MPTVTVHFHGPIDRRGHPQGVALPIEPAITTVSDLLRELGYSETLRKVILANVGGVQRKHSHVLGDGEVVEIFVVASGG